MFTSRRAYTTGPVISSPTVHRKTRESRRVFLNDSAATTTAGSTSCAYGDHTAAPNDYNSASVINGTVFDSPFPVETFLCCLGHWKPTMPFPDFFFFPP